MVHDCIFCSIIQKKIPAKIIEETDRVLVIQDIQPKAPIHYLIIPKKHVESVQSLEDADHMIATDLFAMARHLGSRMELDPAYRLIINTGRDAGQSVFHVHMHFLSGKKMLDF